MQAANIPRVVDVDRVERKQALGAEASSAMLLFPPGMPLPEGWQTPWARAGWAVRSCRSAASIPRALASADASALVAAPWPETSAANSPATIARGLQHVIEALGVDIKRVPVAALADGGMLRRGTFPARLVNILSEPRGHGFVLLAVRIDDAKALGERLDRSAIFDLEERVCARFASVLDAHDATTIWLEFGFGVLVRREHVDAVSALAEQICSSVADQPFEVAGGACALTVSVRMTLAPRTRNGDGAQVWFASAHAAQGIASRRGGNCSEGLLTRATSQCRRSAS
ncbi:MAG: hypothetical protein ABI650_00175 [Dokdonella sp.]